MRATASASRGVRWKNGETRWPYCSRELRPDKRLRSRVPGGHGLVPRYDEAQFLNHLVIGLGRLSFRRQVIADEYRIGGIEPQRLQAAQVQLAATGDPQFAPRIDEPKHGQRLQTVPRIQPLAVSQRRAV